MEPFLVTIFFFLSTLKIITIFFFFLKRALKQARPGRGDACTPVISGERHTPTTTFFFFFSTKEC